MVEQESIEVVFVPLSVRVKRKVRHMVHVNNGSKRVAIQQIELSIHQVMRSRSYNIYLACRFEVLAFHTVGSHGLGWVFLLFDGLAHHVNSVHGAALCLAVEELSEDGGIVAHVLASIVRIVRALWIGRLLSQTKQPVVRVVKKVSLCLELLIVLLLSVL